MSTLPLNHSPADEVFKSDRLRSCGVSRHEEHKWHLLQIQTNQGIQCAVGGSDGALDLMAQQEMSLQCFFCLFLSEIKEFMRSKGEEASLEMS